MNHQPVEVLELPIVDGIQPKRGFTKSQAEAYQGRIYASRGQEGMRVGRVVGSYAYRYGEGRVSYGLETEQKMSGGKDMWKGSLNRADIEQDATAIFLRGKLASQAKEELASTNAISPQLNQEVDRTMQYEQKCSLSRGRRM